MPKLFALVELTQEQLETVQSALSLLDNHARVQFNAAYYERRETKHWQELARECRTLRALFNSSILQYMSDERGNDDK